MQKNTFGNYLLGTFFGIGSVRGRKGYERTVNMQDKNKNADANLSKAAAKRARRAEKMRKAVERGGMKGDL